MLNMAQFATQKEKVDNVILVNGVKFTVTDKTAEGIMRLIIEELTGKGTSVGSTPVEPEPTPKKAAKAPKAKIRKRDNLKVVTPKVSGSAGKLTIVDRDKAKTAEKPEDAILPATCRQILKDRLTAEGFDLVWNKAGFWNILKDGKVQTSGLQALLKKVILPITVEEQETMYKSWGYEIR